jgi:hypothetical protein
LSACRKKQESASQFQPRQAYAASLSNGKPFEVNAVPLGTSSASIAAIGATPRFDAFRFEDLFCDIEVSVSMRATPL